MMLWKTSVCWTPGFCKNGGEVMKKAALSDGLLIEHMGTRPKGSAAFRDNPVYGMYDFGIALSEARP